MKIKYLIFALLPIYSALAQNAQPVPFAEPQYFNGGVPNAGGFVYTYAAGTTTPLASYTDATATVANTNPVVLDANGRANIWLAVNVGYKIVVQTSSAVTIFTQDNLVTTTTNSGPWVVSGATIYYAGGKVGVGCNSVTTVSQLDVCGFSAGANYLVRIDDGASSPGINLYGNGIKLGSIEGDTTAAFRVRAGNDASQLAVTNGVTTFQNQQLSTGTTQVIIQAGAGNGTTDQLFTVQNYAGSTIGYINDSGQAVMNLYNASTSGGTGFTFQNSNSTFLVDGNGDVTLSGQFAIASISGSTQCLQVNSSGIVSGTGATCGSGGGGGSPPFTDNNNIVESNADHTKQFNIDATTNVPTSTTITMHVPANSFTPVSIENADTITGAKTFTQIVTGPVFDATNTTTNLVFNSANFEVNGNGIVNQTSASGAIISAGYVDTGLWYGFNPQATTPSPNPGGGYSGMAFCPATTSGCSDGLTYWFWVPSPTSSWTKVDLGVVAAPGLTAINSQTGPTITLAGTSNQITATTTSNTVTFSFPSTISTSTINSSQSGGSGNAFTISNGLGNPLIINGNGDVNIAGAFTSTASSSITGDVAFRLNTTTIIDGTGRGIFNNLTLSGVTGSTQCLHVNSSGVVSGTGSDCGSGGGGVTSLNSLTGGLTINNGSTSNEITVTPSGSAISLTLPQPIGTGSTVTFGSVTAGVGFTSNASGSTTAFQTSNSNFSVNGNGAANFFSRVYANGGYVVGSWPSGPFSTVIDSSGDFNTPSGAVYEVNGTTVIDAARNIVNAGTIAASGGISSSGNIVTTGSNAILAGGNVQAGGSGSGVFVVNGAYGISRTGGITIGSCTLYFTGGILYSAVGC